MIKKITAIVLAIVFCLSLFGCADEGAGLKKVTVSEVTHSVFYAPQYAAIALGYFEEEGLEIELINGGGADNVMTSVLSGQVDIGFAGPEACVYVANEGKEASPKVFAQLTRCDGSFLIARQPDDAFSYDKLKGKHVIGGRTGGMPLMTLTYVLNKNGVTLDEMNMDTSIDFNNMTAAFTGGIGDYVTAFEPTASMLEEEGLGYIVASIGKDSGDIPYTAYFANEQFLSEQRETALAFTRAIYKAQQWIKTAPDEEIAKAIAPYFDGTTVEELSKAVKSYKAINAWCETPVMAEESLENLLNVIDFSDELEARPAFESVVDNSIANEVTA